ncbi:hypothetical protein GALL_554200 [mine drainage metagenome]|uniref:Uncharacterized protein n=1 Tax=mine drainage metagenome TaxID=410659 RepID=A0A1J5PHL0_9ZZZZ
MYVLVVGFIDLGNVKQAETTTCFCKITKQGIIVRKIIIPQVEDNGFCRLKLFYMGRNTIVSQVEIIDTRTDPCALFFAAPHKLLTIKYTKFITNQSYLFLFTIVVHS